VLHRLDGLAVGILIFIRRSLPRKLLAGLWVLALAEFRKVLGRDRSGEAELIGKPALPFACDHAPLRPIVLLLRSELLLVVALRLASGERLGNRQHVSNPRTKGEFTLALFLRLIVGLRHSILLILPITYGLRFGVSRGF